MLTDLIEQKKKELQARETFMPQNTDSTDWGQAKTKVDALSNNFGDILKKALDTRYESVKTERRGKDVGVTVQLGRIMGNKLVLQITNLEKASGEKARYIMTEHKGNRAYVRNLTVEVV